MLNDPLANVLSKVLNAEKIGQKEVMIKPFSKLIKDVLKVLNEEGYVGTFEEKDNSLTLNLLGNINKSNVIKPRYAVKVENYEKYEKRYLPAKEFGVLILTTPKGVITHRKAKELKTGGKLLAYCY
jgi:small subunit ribosomal protein S8